MGEYIEVKAVSGRWVGPYRVISRDDPARQGRVQYHLTDANQNVWVDPRWIRDWKGRA